MQIFPDKIYEHDPLQRFLLQQAHSSNQLNNSRGEEILLSEERLSLDRTTLGLHVAQEG